MKRRRQSTENRESARRPESSVDYNKLAQRKEGFSKHYEEHEFSSCQVWVGIFLLLTSGGYLFWQLLLPAALNFLETRDLSVYKIPHALPKVGDKSLKYQLLRLSYDLRQDDQRSLQAVKQLNWRQYRPIQGDEVSYNVLRCPFEPPDNYPYAWNVLDVVSHWPVDDLTPRDTIHQGICLFDYKIDYDKALNYRSKEFPYVVRGDPAVARTVERWHQGGYLARLWGETPHRTEVSNHSHFMYWVHPELAKRRARKSKSRINYDAPPDWKPPTEMSRMTYQEWLEVANATERRHDFHYFQVVGCGDVPKCEEGSTEFLFDELPYFQPRPNSFYSVKPEKHQGIHCRFGVPGLSIGTYVTKLASPVLQNAMNLTCLLSVCICQSGPF
jgi:hypothetical protein